MRGVGEGIVSFLSLSTRVCYTRCVVSSTQRERMLL